MEGVCLNQKEKHCLVKGTLPPNGGTVLVIFICCSFSLYLSFQPSILADDVIVPYHTHTTTVSHTAAAVKVSSVMMPAPQ
jgi:hypothetical protein